MLPSILAASSDILDSQAPCSVEVERVPTKRTCARITGLEPFEQAAGVEEVLARRASLGWELFVCADNRVADGTLCLALERSSYVLAPGGEAVNDAAVLREAVSKLARRCDDL